MSPDLLQKMSQMRQDLNVDAASDEHLVGALETMTSSPEQAEAVLCNLHGVLANRPKADIDAWLRVQPMVAGALLAVYLGGGDKLVARLDRVWETMRQAVPEDDWARFLDVAHSLRRAAGA